jgi:hypothetical protein
MTRVRLLTFAILSAAALSACAPTLGPPPPPRGSFAPPSADEFRPGDFSWSAVPGHGGITGHVVYKVGQRRFTCAGASVILTPETPWSRHRMNTLYKSAEHAALPADEVRARTPSAPAGDYSAFVRRTTCAAGDRFSFSGLPEGAWYVITIAKPAAGPGPSMALMRRAVTRDGRVTNVDL